MAVTTEIAPNIYRICADSGRRADCFPFPER